MTSKVLLVFHQLVVYKKTIAHIRYSLSLVNFRCPLFILYVTCNSCPSLQGEIDLPSHVEIIFHYANRSFHCVMTLNYLILMRCHMIIYKALWLDKVAEFNFEFNDKGHNFLKITRQTYEMSCMTVSLLDIASGCIEYKVIFTEDGL